MGGAGPPNAPNAPTQFAPATGPNLYRPGLPPGPPAPAGSRKGRNIAIAAAVAVVAVIAVVVGIVVTGGGDHGGSDFNPPPADTPGALFGTYRADFGPETSATGKPLDSTPRTGTFHIRSVCRNGACVATAAVSDGPVMQQRLIFDQVGESWTAVGISNATPQTPAGLRKNCPEDKLLEIWESIALRAKPDGTFSGEYMATNKHLCSTTRPVTFTHTGDVDVASLPNPADQPARVSTPAEGLHGRYHRTVNWEGRPSSNDDFEVKTYCLRTGDRCMSYFHSSKGADPLLFADGKWTEHSDNDYDCTPEVRAHNVSNAEFPLPDSAPNPIMVLTGHGHSDVAPGNTCSGSLDFQTKYERTGD